MRRLAKQSRDDTYSSQQDYQTIEEQTPVLIVGRGQPVEDLAFKAAATIKIPHVFGFGAYIMPSSPTALRLTIDAKDADKCIDQELATIWNRVGLATAVNGLGDVAVRLRFNPPIERLLVWGLEAASLELPEGVAEADPDTDLSAAHLAPETLYLSHEEALAAEFEEDRCSDMSLPDSDSTIQLKKCAYCGRWLPIDMDRLGSLAFHKHNAKKTLHQNECRSCKKWRINDSFNPKRTKDQLHESSVISRERKLFLREPEVLQLIKDREGQGLKSIIWDRFDRKCFRCDIPLTIDEVRLDHTRPMAYLWPIDEHATCLCEGCNNHKKDRFPVEFYSADELQRLSEITGLPVADLSVRDVCPEQLDRILGDITGFARAWECRTFNSTARKVREVRKDVDLYQILRDADPSLHDEVVACLEDRPDPVE